MPQENKPQEPSTITVYPVHIPTAADSIDLVSIWRIFGSHRKTFFRLLFLLALTSVLAAFLIPKKYDVITTIEIGSYYSNGSILQIDNMSSLKAKIIEAYTPKHYRKIAEASDWNKKPSISVNSRGSNNVVAIVSKTLLKDVEHYKQLQSLISRQIIAEHTALTDRLTTIFEDERAFMNSLVKDKDERPPHLNTDPSFKYMINQSRILGGPTLSIKPISISRTLTLAALLVLSFIVAVGAVLLLELRNRARQADS